MPELPEVEAIRRALADGAMGREPVVQRRIARVEVPSERVVRELDREVFAAALTGRVIERVGRRAKTLRFALDDGTELLVHLRMTGDLLTQGASPRDRVRLCFLDGGVLRLEDPRHLAEVWLVDDAAQRFADLGPEPFDAALTAARLHERLGRGTRSVKAALLDQTVVAGVGNIWADEALLAARLHPATPVRALTEEDAARLLEAIREALHGATEELVAHGIEWVYRGRRDVEPPGQIHAREGQPCPVCGARIVKTKVAGRGTYLCPRCQRAA